MNSIRTVLVILAAALAVVACQVEDQRFKPGTEAWKEVNPGFGSLEQIVANNRAHEAIVAVLDSGVDYLHPSIRRNMHFNLGEVNRSASTGHDDDGNAVTDDFLGWDFAGDDGFPSYRLFSSAENRRAMDVELQTSASHGTHVSGIVAQGDHRIGIIPFRVIPIASDSRDPSVQVKLLADSLKQAIYMAKRQGARVVNMSLGATGQEMMIPEPTMRAVFKNLQRYIDKAAKDMVIVIAAGNSTIDLSSGAKVYPCQLRVGNVVCVGSVNDQGEISEFSNRGLQFVDIFARGEKILSSVPVDHVSQGEPPYMPMDGTSMAAPYVAHVAARVLIKKPCLSAAQVIGIMRDTAVRRTAKLKLGNSKRDEYRYRIVDLKAAERRAENTRCE